MISPASTQTRVFVIEPQPLLARAICATLSAQPDVTIAGSAAFLDPGEVSTAAADIIVIDCDTDLGMLADIILQCRRRAPDVRICVLSMSLSADIMMQAISAGANGYIVKDITPEALVTSIRSLKHDGFYADPRLSSLMLKRGDKRGSDLSPRERDVARLIGQGLSNKEIGGRLALSDKTVKNHVANIFAKLNFTARTQVAIYALRNGLV